MRKKVIRITENDIHNMVSESVKAILREEGPAGASGCGGVMQGGGTNPSAGQYDVPFISDEETEKRNDDFENGSISMHRVGESIDVLRRPIYKTKLNR